MPGTCRSARLKSRVNMMSVLNPVKAKLDGKIEKRQRSRSPSDKANGKERPITEEEGAWTYMSPMNSKPLKDKDEKLWSEEEVPVSGTLEEPQTGRKEPSSRTTQVCQEGTSLSQPY